MTLLANWTAKDGGRRALHNLRANFFPLQQRLGNEEAEVKKSSPLIRVEQQYAIRGVPRDNLNLN